MVFGPFRSENGYTALCPFWSGTGYCFSRELWEITNVFIVSNPSE